MLSLDNSLRSIFETRFSGQKSRSKCFTKLSAGNSWKGSIWGGKLFVPFGILVDATGSGGSRATIYEFYVGKGFKMAKQFAQSEVRALSFTVEVVVNGCKEP